MIARLIWVAVLAWISFPLLADTFLPLTPEIPNGALSKYKCSLRDTLAPIWRSEMEKNKTSLRWSLVQIRFRVNADGSISDPMVVVGESAGLNKTVSMKVLLSAAPFKPFNPDLIQEVGKSYIDQIDFTVEKESFQRRDQDLINSRKEQKPDTSGPD